MGVVTVLLVLPPFAKKSTPDRRLDCGLRATELRSHPFSSVITCHQSRVVSLCTELSIQASSNNNQHLTILIFAPPQGFGPEARGQSPEAKAQRPKPRGQSPEAKTRRGTLAVPRCIHTRTKNIC